MTPTAEQALEALNTLADAAVEILWTEKCLELAKLVRQHLESAAAELEAWRKLYRRAVNEANGLTNYVEDRPELRRAERNLTAIETEARALTQGGK